MFFSFILFPIQHTSHDEDENIAFCVSDMQGWRISMEDAHAAVLNLMDDANVSPKDRVSFFAVYDGHGGTYTVSQATNIQALVWHATLGVPCTHAC